MAKYYDRCWNPIFGCKGNFTGCENCYAKSLLKRREKSNYDFNDVSVNKKQYKKKFDLQPQLISVCTQSDLFQNDIPDDIINGVLRKCNKINYNNYLFLTKYSQNMKNYFADSQRMSKLLNNHFYNFDFNNMMFGVTVCDNNDIHRISDLQATKLIKHRFIAFEPIYEKINLTAEHLQNIEWIIIGCETGENPKYCNMTWITDLISFIEKFNIPIFLNAIPVNDFDKSNYNKIPYAINAF